MEKITAEVWHGRSLFSGPLKMLRGRTFGQLATVLWGILIPICFGGGGGYKVFFLEKIILLGIY